MAGIIGGLRRRVTLQTETHVSDEAGGYTVGWSDVATVWVEVTPLSGQERYAARRIQAQVTHRVRMRYREGVTASMRIVCGGRFFNIRAVLNRSEAGRWLELLAEEGVAV